MTQRRTSQQTVAWAQRPATWTALAVLFLAISAPQWVAVVGDGKGPALVPALAFSLAAVLFAVQARRCARRRS